MSTPGEEISVEVGAVDEAAAKKAAAAAKNDPAVVVDPEVSARSGSGADLTPAEGVQKLQKQLEDERAARLAAETRANEAARGEAEAQTKVQQTQLDQVKGAIAQIGQSNDVLEDQYAEAMQAGDFKAAAKVQRQMGDNSAKIAQLEAGKTALERAPKPVPRVPTDPVEAFVAGMTAPSAAWVRAHPDFVTDQHKNKQMIAAHEFALARGFKADTDDYFKSIEKTLDLPATVARTLPAHHDENPDPTADAARETGGRSGSPPAAPVSRSGNGAGGRPTTVKLTPEQVEAAYISFPDSKTPLQDYANQVLAIKRETK